jgi:hypothetical protein
MLDLKMTVLYHLLTSGFFLAFTLGDRKWLEAQHFEGFSKSERKDVNF